MRLFLLTLFIFPVLAIATNTYSYTLYIASTKYKDVAKTYMEEIDSLLKLENLQVRTHIKQNYSVIISQIKSKNEAKKIQNKLSKISSYKDTYIKKESNNLKYGILYFIKAKSKETIKINENEKKDEEDYILDIESSNEYITASAIYNIGNYKRSYELFTKLFYKYNYNVNINYFLAQSAINIGMLDEASIALERVLIQNPKFNKARYDYARLLTKLNLKEEAKKEFNILLKENITKETKEDVQKYLIYLNKEKKYTSNSATLILGMGHNTNINNGLLTKEYKLPGINNVTVQGEDPISDSFHNQVLSLNFNRNLKTNPSIRIVNNFLAYNKNYFNQKDENISVLSYRPNISYIKNQNLYAIDFNASRVIKKEKNDINVFSISPSIVNKYMNTSLKYQKLLYANNENKAKNFETYSFEFTYNLVDNLKIQTNITKVARIEKERVDISKILKSIGLYYTHEFSKKNIVYLSYKLEENDFRDFNTFFNNKRKDTNHNFMLSYLYSINKHNKINLLSSFSRNNSNQDAYAYEQAEATLNYIKNFNW